MKQASVNLEILTGIRGVAAWSVVLYHMRHSLAAILPPSVIDWMAHGYLAVDLFFLLSGFVIWYNYAPRLDANPAGSWRLFYWRRFSRIWPLHAVIMTGFMAFAAFLWATGRSTADYPLDELVLHILLMQNWGFTDLLSWNHPAWSISTEMAAYLLFPLFVLLMAGGRQPLWLLWVMIAGLLTTIGLLFVAAGAVSLGSEIPTLGLPRCLAEFTLGCLMCMLWQTHQRDLESRQASLGLLPAVPLFGAGAVGVLLGVGLGWHLALYVPFVLLCLLGATLTAPAAIAQPLGGLFARGPLHYLGEISYSTYLSHYGLFILFKIIFVSSSLQVEWLEFAAYLLLVLAASVILYHGVEKPAQRWLNAHPPEWIMARRLIDSAG